MSRAIDDGTTSLGGTDDRIRAVCRQTRNYNSWRALTIVSARKKGCLSPSIATPPDTNPRSPTTAPPARPARMRQQLAGPCLAVRADQSPGTVAAHAQGDCSR
jgi:hypothetical protein